MFAKIRFVGLAICAIACVCALTTPAAAQCPAKTTVADTLYNADGSLASGRVTIAWPTFVIGTCQVIAGQTTVTVAIGAFSAQLYPNTTAVPSGTSYRVTFALISGRVTTEYWVVPASAVSVALATVRAPSVPVPAMMFGEAQVTNLVSDLAKKIELPSPCSAGKMLESNGSSTPPQVNCVDPSSGSGSQHQVNGANLASNSPVNFQNSSTVAFTNPGAGNLQASLADSAVTAAKLAVSSPSAAQLAGIGDINISAAALSPDRVVGTAVTQSRAINTTAPIAGGGDLSADRTLTCNVASGAQPGCLASADWTTFNNKVTSVSGTAEEIASTGGATPVISLPSILNLAAKTLKGASPLLFDGLTADTFKTTLVITDPTAARSFTLPNADSNSVQPLTCSGTDKVSAISALGVVTCTADQGGAGSGDNITVNTVAAVDADFDDATPAAPANAANVKWQKDALTPNNLSAHLLFSTIATATFGANADFTWTFDNAGATDPQFQFVAGVLTLAAMTRLDTPNELRNANAGVLILSGKTPDGATAVGVRSNNTVALTVAGAKIHSFQNNSVEKSYIDKDGGFSGNAATATALAVDPTTCTNQFVRDIAAAGTLTCATVAKADAAATFVHTDQANTYSTGTQDFEAAAVTRPYRRLAFASFPGTCTANREFLERSDPATAGQVVYVCNAAGTGWDLVGDGGAGGGITSLASQTGATQTITRGAGIGGTSATNDHSFTTASGEADFLAAGALTCGAATQGKMQVHTTPLQYCDNAATPALQYAAYGDSAGAALTGDTATAFFAAGTLEIARGGTGTGSTLTGLVRGSASAMTAAELSGDVTTSGSNVATLANIPTGTPMAGSLLATNIAAPASPAAGKVSLFTDSTDLRLHDKNASGVIGTTVVAQTCSGTDKVSAVSAAGVVTCSPNVSSGNVTTLALSSDAASNSTTSGVKITGLDLAVGAGTYGFKYLIRYQSAATTTGVKFGVNHTGTAAVFVATMRYQESTTAASTGAASQAAAGGTLGAGGSTRTKSTTAPNLGPTASVDTLSADMLAIIDGIIIVTASGNLELWHASEVAAASTVMSGSSLVLTNLSSGIPITSKIWLEAAACQNATATLMWDTPTTNPAVAACITGTNTQKGVADFADGAASLSMQRTLALPSDWTGAVDVKFKWLTTATTGDVVWQIATICVADAETDDPAFNTASTVTDTAKGTTNQTNDASVTGITMTGCAAGEAWHIKVLRDPAHASDTLAATARLLGVELTVRRAQ